MLKSHSWQLDTDMQLMQTGIAEWLMYCPMLTTFITSVSASKLFFSYWVSRYLLEGDKASQAPTRIKSLEQTIVEVSTLREVLTIKY